MVEERPAAAMPEPRGAVAAMGGRKAVVYADVDVAISERLSPGISEFDRVLGGGIVPGSLVLLGGDPGIGKSTLLLQAAAHFAASVGPVLYCSGEESEHQVKMRGERLGVTDAPLFLLAETCIERLIEEVERLRPSLLIVDSIQTVFSLKIQSAPGSVSQVRQAATDL
jgi:DNA repair protein RadA/Sms